MCTLLNIILWRYARDSDTDKTMGKLSYLAENFEILIFKIHLNTTDIILSLEFYSRDFEIYRIYLRFKNQMSWIEFEHSEPVFFIKFSENQWKSARSASKGISESERSKTSQNLIISYPEFCFRQQHNSEVYRRRT